MTGQFQVLPRADARQGGDRNGIIRWARAERPQEAGVKFCVIVNIRLLPAVHQGVASVLRSRLQGFTAAMKPVCISSSGQMKQIPALVSVAVTQVHETLRFRRSCFCSQPDGPGSAWVPESSGRSGRGILPTGLLRWSDYV